jgi:ribosome-associated heat shock protein Hsp15
VAVRDDATMEATRVDRYLWAVRIYATRAQSTTACRAGHVEINGRPAKAAQLIHVGDEIVVRVGGVPRIFEVTAVIEKRVGAPVAALCVTDHTPAPTPIEKAGPVFARDPSAGRPTKRDRRQLDRLRRS